jgi:flagellar hook-basal body complex protein FliE
VTDGSLTLPKFTQFISEAIDSVNYTFVTTDAYTTNVTANTAVFDDVSIAQGISASYSFTVNKTTNQKLTFDIPDSTIDTSTIVVNVQESSSKLTFETYTQASDYLNLEPSTKVYFQLQEGLNGKYQIYFR